MDIKKSLQWQAAVRTQEEIMARIKDKGLGDRALLKGSYVIQTLAPATVKTIPRLEVVFHETDPEDIKEVILENHPESAIEITEIIEGRRAENPENTSYSLVVKSKVNNINSALYLDLMIFKTREQFMDSVYCCAQSSNKEATPLLSGEEGSIPIPMACPEGVFIDRLTAVTRSGSFTDSMEPYFDLFCLVSGVCLEGRRLGDYLKRFYSREQMEDLAGYKANKGLGARWRAFAREKRVPVKDFPDLVDFIMQVIAPVEEAISKDYEFFGTWMPELCRYIG